MLVYTYPYTPQVVYSTPNYSYYSQEQHLRNVVEAAEAVAARQYLARLEQERIVELRRQEAIRQAEYRRQEAIRQAVQRREARLQAQCTAERRRQEAIRQAQAHLEAESEALAGVFGLPTGYDTRRQGQQRLPFAIFEESSVEDYLGGTLAQLLGLPQEVEAERVRAEKARLEQARKAAIEAARKHALHVAAQRQREEARKAAALEQVRQFKAKRESEEVSSIIDALKVAFAEAGLVMSEPKVTITPREEATSVHSTSNVTALAEARKAEHDRRAQVERVHSEAHTRQNAEVKRRAAIRAKKIVDSDRMRKAAIENARARFAAQIEALKKELEEASKPSTSTLEPKPAATETPVVLTPSAVTPPAASASAPAEEHTSAPVNTRHDRAARTIQRRWRSRSADRATQKDALDTISTLRARFEFLKGTFVAPEHLEFRDPATLSTSSSSSLDSEVPALSFSPMNAAVHTYIHELMKLMMLADGVSSAGSEAIRKVRKEFVKMVEGALEDVDKVVRVVWEKMHADEVKQEEGREGVVKIPILEKSEEKKVEAAEEVKEEAVEIEAGTQADTIMHAQTQTEEPALITSSEPAPAEEPVIAQDVTARAPATESVPNPTEAESETIVNSIPGSEPATESTVSAEPAGELAAEPAQSDSLPIRIPISPPAKEELAQPVSVEIETEVKAPVEDVTLVKEESLPVFISIQEGEEAGEAKEVAEAAEGAYEEPAKEIEESAKEEIEEPTKEDEKPSLTEPQAADEPVAGEAEAAEGPVVSEECATAESSSVVAEEHAEESVVIESACEPVEEPTLIIPSVPTEKPSTDGADLATDSDVHTLSSTSETTTVDVEAVQSPISETFDIVYPESPRAVPSNNTEAPIQSQDEADAAQATPEPEEEDDGNTSSEAEVPQSPISEMEGFEMI